MALLHVIELWKALEVLTTGTGTVRYTVPAGKRVVLRNVSMRNVSSTTGYSLLIYMSGLLVYSKSLAASESFDKDFWIVLGPGETISTRVGNVTGINVTGSGSIYTI